MSENQQNREIDLIELFSKIGVGLKSLFLWFIKAILFILVFGVKKIHWLTIATVLGAAIGYLFYSGTERFYSSSLIIQPNGINSTEMHDYISDLTRYASKRNIPALSFALDLPDSIAKKIKKIESYFYIDINKDNLGDYIDLNRSYNSKDTSQTIVNNRLFLAVEVYDNSAFNELKEGIFRYVDKNPYLIKLNEIRKAELVELIKNINSEIIKLDSLQNVDYFKSDIEKLNIKSDKGLLILSGKDKQMFYRDKINLIHQKQKFEKELELATASITVIKDFTQLSVEENTKGKYIVWFGFWSGLGSFLIILMFRYKDKLITLFNL